MAKINGYDWPNDLSWYDAVSDLKLSLEIEILLISIPWWFAIYLKRFAWWVSYVWFDHCVAP